MDVTWDVRDCYLRSAGRHMNSQEMQLARYYLHRLLFRGPTKQPATIVIQIPLVHSHEDRMSLLYLTRSVCLFGSYLVPLDTYRFGPRLKQTFNSSLCLPSQNLNHIRNPVNKQYLVCSSNFSTTSYVNQELNKPLV